jgi:hypothetical protein
MAKAIMTGFGMPDLCENCNRVLTAEDIEDGVTILTDCCELCGLCSECRKPGNHDCEVSRD